MSLAVALAGWAAAGALLAAYALVSIGRLSGAGRPFQALNLLGAAGLMLNSAEHRAWPSVALNGIWILIGLATLTGLASARRRNTTAMASLRGEGQGDGSARLRS
ncbi:CBU_0592 family membrane protein [Streptacidiphilus albus]|uniref:CBU_0592 family membrane protein n=1 Tax=Streptacidiphilus albus TaxID=105425 RepID=UPI0005A8BE00|nr:hypothetical protein [Streptacidiphilus albus]